MKITRIREDYLARLAREPDIEEICSFTNETPERICEAINVALPPISLTPADDDSKELMIPVSAQDEKITDILSLRHIIRKLEPEEKKLIYLRYYKNLTQVKTAKLLNLTQVQVSRKEKKLLEKMRLALI